MTVAVKHLSEVMFTNQTIKREFEREVEIMRGIRHPNIVVLRRRGNREKRRRNEGLFILFLLSSSWREEL